MHKVTHDAVEEAASTILIGLVIVMNPGNKPNVGSLVETTAGGVFESLLEDERTFFGLFLIICLACDDLFL